MCSYLALFVSVGLTAVISTNVERVSCRQVRQGNGNIKFDCVSVVRPADLCVRNLYVLWLKSKRTGGDQSIAINVPNYRIENVIQAAVKGGQSQAHTNINVNLRHPELSYLAQKDERVGRTIQTFDVNLLYERLLGKTVHFADEGAGSERYAPLHGIIPEPPNYSDLIKRLIRLMSGTFKEVGEIAAADNPEVGQSIINTLNGELGKANKIYEDYQASLTTGGRRKRSPGSDALDGVKGVAKGAGGAIDSDKKKLGAGSQMKVDKSLAKLAKCADSDACINTLKDLTSGGSEQ